MPAYNGGLFDSREHRFLAERKLPDWYLARVIDQLGRAEDPQEPPDAGLFRVDYRDLAIQHLGSIYEGLLELQPRRASERMKVIARRTQGRLEERVIRASDPVPAGYQEIDTSYRRGSIYLETNKGERRATGSYYTPDHIVKHIVEEALGPVCRGVAQKLSAEIAEAERRLSRATNSARNELTQTLDRLRADYANRILRLRVLDPAMGSGHFLLRACQFLAEEIATNPHTSEEGSLTVWKRKIVEHCLYGVDMNGLAVELAKLALWLETVTTDKPLTFLDHHLRHGNSLIGARLSELNRLPGDETLLTAAFSQAVEQHLPTLLGPLGSIRQTGSDTPNEIKTKQRLYANFEKARGPFLQTADLWCSAFVPSENPLMPDQYRQATEALSNPTRFNQIASEPWFQEAIPLARRPDMICFHWELEFPDAFFSDTGRRRTDAGFDGVIGNPPYDVLSELETGQDLTAFKAFIEHDPVYEPSRRGKNNLYKLFICRAIDLLADGGYLGFITPMAVLGDDQAAEIRRKMVALGCFNGIEAFPQKDDPANRIFPEAKLSTAVFALFKGKPPDSENRRFTSRVHPGREIKFDSPSLTLTTAGIPLYDPANFTIVSCSQGDWDLATRITASGRMQRLSQLCTSFQGEVNETTERKKGSLSKAQREGPLILRGSNVCLYAVREASQGEDYFIREAAFFRDKPPTSKAYHSRQERAGFQRSSPQNNFRRIVAAIIAPRNFCFDTVSYVPDSTSRLPLRFLVALLNSQLADWYFRLGSTNSKVNEYQFNNLPCPAFDEISESGDRKLEETAIAALHAAEFDRAFDCLRPALSEPPFSLAIRAVIVEAVNEIMALERDRGEIARVERSALDPAAQPYQDLIDRLFYAMAGLTVDEAAGLEERLGRML